MNIRENQEFGEGATIKEMAVADNDSVPKPLPEWFDAAMIGGLIFAAIILFTIIYQVLTWH